MSVKRFGGGGQRTSGEFYSRIPCPIEWSVVAHLPGQEPLFQECIRILVLQINADRTIW